MVNLATSRLSFLIDAAGDFIAFIFLVAPERETRKRQFGIG